MRRLAGLVALGMGTACGGDGPTEPPLPVETVARVVIVPDSVSLPRGQSMRLEATLYDAGGNMIEGRTIAWSTTNPGTVRVEGSGLITAQAVGTALVIARSESKADTVKVLVTE